ncbi:MAG: peptide-methionine (S)-S-oxide reductase MsrA [Bacteroidia bacterium]|nr:peptide-methionine (S)-S-oxide reductase MsrA [Bacteroidia bacterium]MCZ2141061.1 peptide-methionine (S)-S-oxide reductase MsrA [Bacteroidia bacterium]
MNRKFKHIFCYVIFGILFSFCSNSKIRNGINDNIINMQQLDSNIAILGGGCFWCVEAQLQQLDGVDTMISGYSGGTKVNPTYQEVCTGNTGHAEVCKIIFDENKISYKDLLYAFFTAHDPTTFNRQGDDIGTQYRSVIFYINDAQKQIANEVISDLTSRKIFDNPIVTEVKPLSVFYPAENYHQNYYNLNSGENYCRFVISPKLNKFRKEYISKLKQK